MNSETVFNGHLNLNMTIAVPILTFTNFLWIYHMKYTIIVDSVTSLSLVEESTYTANKSQITKEVSNKLRNRLLVGIMYTPENSKLLIKGRKN